ncbi:MAG: hypothetical protein PHE17_08965 [Thiothrix sp.]|uniref:hypothetical protein n=1 Tax=Thiothrix sp. TaxID=1032 RepID=UPI0026198361|nr:hypothetical protein [Thiothrix sp.]MDD5393134.1 hypothetical protein [Thiothrix sp.]
MNKKYYLTALLASSLLGFANVGMAAACSAANSLVQVQDTSPAGLYEYVIFTVKSPMTGTYKVSSVKPPFEHDPSGTIVKVKGTVFKQINFAIMDWMCSTNHQLSLPDSQIQDVKNVGNFEGVVTYVVGYKSAAKYLNTYQYPAGGYTKVVMRFKK